MNTTKYVLSVAGLLLLAAHAAAQTDDPAREADERARETESREQELAERLREAEQRLEEAARRVAELSAERLGSMGDVERYAFRFSDKPRLGVSIESSDASEPVEGVRVIGVTPGTAAADAGLRAGDVITSVNGESLSATSPTEANKRLLDFMSGVEEGDRVDVEYLRDGKVGKVEVEPRVVEGGAFAWAPRMRGGMPGLPELHVAPEMVEKFAFRLGGLRGPFADMELVELTEGLGRYFGTDSGMLVINAPKSNVLQLQEGDVIQSIDGREPSSVNQCMRILGTYEPGEKIVLNIMRDRKRQQIEVEVPDDRSSFLFMPGPHPALPAAAPQPAAVPQPAPPPAAAFDEQT